MPNVRLIARLDVKGPNLVKGIQFEGLRKLGNPNDFARKYYTEGIDEILYIDIVASLYERNNLVDIVRKATHDVFVPLTVGGGIRSIEDARTVLRSGADKIAINTAAIRCPDIIDNVAKRFGSQCMVLSIEAKNIGPGRWQCYYDNGREKTGIDVVSWAKQGSDRGAGEILLMSVDMEGTAKGLDFDLIGEVCDKVPIPVIAGGGVGSIEHVIRAVEDGGADAIAMAHVLHYGKLGIAEIRTAAVTAGLNVRRV